MAFERDFDRDFDINLDIDFDSDEELLDYSEMDEKLFRCAVRGDLMGVQAALIKGADVNKGNPAKRFGNSTPFMEAASRGYFEVADYLLNNGANPNATNSSGGTVLHIAAHDADMDAIKYLLEHKVNPLIVNEGNKTAQDIAKEVGFDVAANYIESYTDILSYEDAMKEGHLLLTNKKLVLMGPPCTGKTAFKDLLFDWPAPKHHNSTPLASRPIRAMERISNKSKDGGVWDIVQPSEVCNTVSDAIQARDEYDVEDLPTIDPLPSDSDNDLVDDITLKPSNDTFTAAEPHVNDVGTTSTENMSQIEETSNDNVTQTNQRIYGASDQSIEIVRQLRKKRHNKRSIFRSKPKALHKATWVHVLDSGGQPQFADISRAFLRGNAVNIITHKLTERLSDKPHFTYSINGKVMNAPEELQMTNMQLIEHFVRSIGAAKTTTIKIGDKIIDTKPFFIIIGTYYDKATTGVFTKKEIIEETIAEKNQQLLAALEEFREHFIFFNKDSNELIFPVDNLCRLNRKKISAQIRERIMSQEGVGFKVPIPIRWYLFELEMRKVASLTEHGIISLQSCYEIGIKMDMDKKDVIASLVYLDAMTLCLYYKKVLPYVIFTNPQYLLDMISNIVRTSFITSLQEILPKGHSLSSDTQRLLHEDGVFEKSLLDTLGLPFVPSLFTKDDFLRLLQHISVIASIDSPDPVCRYFMPVVLSTDTLPERQKQAFSTHIEPLVITFNNKVVLQGLFPTLIVSLLSREEEPEFFIDSRSTNFPRQLRHAVSLYSEDLCGSVFLCDEYTSITVYFTGRPNHCYTLRQVILQAISTSATTLGYDKDTLETSALVRCNRQHILTTNDSNPHPISFFCKDNVPLVGCSVETLPVLDLSDERIKCWLIEPWSPGVDPVPDVFNLPANHLSKEHGPLILSAIREVNTWEVLGIHLGLKFAKIEEIKKNNHYQVQTCRKSLIETWLQGGTATGHALKLALKATRMNSIIRKISMEPVGSPSCTVSESLPNGKLNEEHAPLLLRKLNDLNKWQELGAFLGLTKPMTDQIKIDNHSIVETCRMVMLVRWLQTDTATSDELISALKRIKMDVIANELQQLII